MPAPADPGTPLGALPDTNNAEQTTGRIFSFSPYQHCIFTTCFGAAAEQAHGDTSERSASF